MGLLGRGLSGWGRRWGCSPHSTLQGKVVSWYKGRGQSTKTPPEAAEGWSWLWDLRGGEGRKGGLCCRLALSSWARRQGALKAEGSRSPEPGRQCRPGGEGSLLYRDDTGQPRQSRGRWEPCLLWFSVGSREPGPECHNVWWKSSERGGGRGKDGFYFTPP